MLKVDSREPEKVFDILNNLQIEYIKEALDVGDFLCEEKGIVFERKTIPDFCNSFLSGHLQKQLLQMEQFENKYLILIGNPQTALENGEIKVRLDQFYGMISSINVRTNTKIINVLTELQGIKMILKIIEKTNDGKILGIQHTELMKNKLRTEDIHLMMLSCVPNIGNSLGKKILEKYTLYELFEVLVEDLCEIEGIGIKKANKIKEYLHVKRNI